MNALYDIFVYSLTALLCGLRPLVRHDNTQFADSTKIGDSKRAAKCKTARALPVKGGCIQKRGDWAFMKTVLNVTGWYDGPEKSCCFTCKANYTTLPFCDFWETALWRQTCLKFRIHYSYARPFNVHVLAQRASSTELPGTEQAAC